MYCAFSVALGSTHVPRLHVDEAFSPVVCVESLLSLPASAALEDLHKGVVWSATLNSELEDEG